MEEFTPANLDPISEVIQRVRSLKRPGMRAIDCQALEKRFFDQDWISQLDIYELWLDIGNQYTLNCLYRRLCSGYWELLQELITKRGSARAKEIAARIERTSIAHMRMQIVAYFVTTYMPIDILRKHQRTLSRYLDMAYLSLAERLGGDAGFKIEKDRIYPLLAYYRICEKFHLKTSDEEALADFKDYMKHNWMQLTFDFPQTAHCSMLCMSLLQNADIRGWYNSVKALGLTRAAKAFERFDSLLHDRIKAMFNADEICEDFQWLPMESQQRYWHILRAMAIDELNSSSDPEETPESLFHAYPELSRLAEELNLEIADPLRL